MKLIVLFALPVLVGACSSETSQDIVIPTKDPLIITDSEGVDSSENKPASLYSSEVFETKGLGWGYKIFENGTLFINQPHIPAIQGNKGFSTKEKAQITADFAILKMEQGFIPPTISPEELDSLGVLD